MQNSENNNWIISDPLEKNYDIYANKNVITTLLNFNHFWIM